MKSKFLLLSTLFVFFSIYTSFSQKIKVAKNAEAIVSYAYKTNGKELKGRSLQLQFKNNIARLYSGSQAGNGNLQYLDYNRQASIQMMNFQGKERFTLITPFTEYEKPILLNELDTILGYPCQKAKVIIRSNTIVIWFTKALPIKGSPNIDVAPGIGLILKTIRNGDFETYATKVDFQKINDTLAKLPANLGSIVNEATFRRKQIDNRFTTIPVFTHQQINFTDSIINPDDDKEGATYRYAGGTLVLKKIKLPSSENYTVLADLSQYSNADAYDRTGSVFIIPLDKKNSFLNGIRNGVKALPVYKSSNGKEYQGVVATENYLPPVELMRFFTPFGVRAFNQQSKIAGYHWADSVHYKQDITDLVPRLTGVVWVGVFIGNYDKKGHTINLDFEYHPLQDSAKEKPNWIMPIFNTLNLLEMAGQSYATMFDNDSLKVTVDIPEHLKSLTLRYISTGHGGWDGGDEFNKKLNEIFMDGKRLYSFIPWRSDCATYRFYNPSSGNFGDGLSSSDLSRSNWCPGTTTNPVYIPITDFTAGKHTFSVAIPLGKPEGSSFSAWNVSGVLIGEY
ncbi:MAG: peptide-N-glycosidase [Bacteroidetes bacterium]|nr:peptide-N-glycosidase [Bacteroidota bacterium]MBS1758242.1 peptide-N-glycosidase [Bacteroidota bacterium]